MHLPVVSRFGGLGRRRLVLFAVVATVLVVIGSAFAINVARDHLAGAGPVPAQDQPGPALLVPGYGGGTAALEVLATAIRATGRIATVVPALDDGTGDLDRQADALDNAVRRVEADNGGSVDIIGYSAGGVVARLWAQRHDGAHRARRIVTLGAPHHGTKLAAAGILLAPGACPKACQQLAPGSPLLRSLTTPVPSPPRWLAVWTDQDQTVTPPDSGHLEGAVNVAVQALCPQRPVSHSQLPTDSAVTAVVLQALGADPLVAPDAAACAG